MKPFLFVLGLTPLLAGLVVAAPPLNQKGNAPKPDLGRVAVDLAAKLGAQLVKQAPKEKGEKYRVAVFAFGNSEGKYPLEMGDNGPILRGALVDELRQYLDKHAPGKFATLYPEQVDEQIKDGSADPAGISGKNLALARKLLRGYDFQVGIVGRVDVKRPKGDSDIADDGLSFVAAPGGDDSHGTKIQASAILPETTLAAATEVEPRELGRYGFFKGSIPSFGPTKRLSPSFFVKIDEEKKDSDPRAWKALPLSVSKDEKKRGVFYLVIPKDYRGKRYKVVLTNHGEPQLPLGLYKVDKLDPDRLFAAALLIDGVNSFMRHDGNQYRHVAGQPAALSKWVLTPVGKRLVPDKEGIKGRVQGAKFAGVEGKGGSQAHVLGFQKGRDVAGSFVFARAVDSVAAPEMLATRKIGTISVYFFAERLPGDLQPPAAGPGGEAGTAMGKEVRSATFPVKVLDWYRDPVAVWHILYRYEGDDSLPDDLVPLK